MFKYEIKKKTRKRKAESRTSENSKWLKVSVSEEKRFHFYVSSTLEKLTTFDVHPTSAYLTLSLLSLFLYDLHDQSHTFSSLQTLLKRN